MQFFIKDFIIIVTLISFSPSILGTANPDLQFVLDEVSLKLCARSTFRFRFSTIIDQEAVSFSPKSFSILSKTIYALSSFKTHLVPPSGIARVELSSIISVLVTESLKPRIKRSSKLSFYIASEEYLMSFKLMSCKIVLRNDSNQNFQYLFPFDVVCFGEKVRYHL